MKFLTSHNATHTYMRSVGFVFTVLAIFLSWTFVAQASHPCMYDGNPVGLTNVHRDGLEHYGDSGTYPDGYHIFQWADLGFGNGVSWNQSNGYVECGYGLPATCYPLVPAFFPSCSGPDLASESLSLSSGSYTEGTPITLMANVRNHGLDTATGFTDTFIYEWNNSGIWNNFPGNTNTHPAGLAMDSTLPDTASFTPAQGGTLRIRHCVDFPTDAVAEPGLEGNNCTTSGSVVVTPLPPPPANFVVTIGGVPNFPPTRADGNAGTYFSSNQTVLVLTNNGGSTGTISVSGGGLHFDRISSGGPIAIAPNASHNVIFRFDPVTAGTKVQNITFVSSANPISSINLSGDGVPMPSGTLSTLTGSCSIAVGASTCDIGVTWNVNNPISPALRQASLVSPPFSIAPSHLGFSRTLQYGNTFLNTMFLTDVGLAQSITPNAVCVTGSSWDGVRCVNPSISGVSVPTCTIAANQSSCNSTIAWTISNPINPVNVRDDSVTFSQSASGPHVEPLEYGNNTIDFYSNGVLLDTRTVNITCAAGTSWNVTASQCRAPSLGSLSVTGCDILVNQSTCNGTTSWSINNPLVPAIRDDAEAPFSNSNAGTNVSVTFEQGNNTVYVVDNGTQLGSQTVAANCVSGTVWNATDGLCRAPSFVSASSGDCTIVLGASTCTGYASWTMLNTISPSVADDAEPPFSTGVAVGVNVPFTMEYGTNVLRFSDVNGQLGTLNNLQAYCNAQGGWDGSACRQNVRAQNVSPADGAKFARSSDITFQGEIINTLAGVVQPGYLGLEVDTNGDGNADDYYAWPTINTAAPQFNSISSNATEAFSITIPANTFNGGTFRYRFNIDSSNLLVEHDESDNRSAWRTFVIHDVPNIHTFRVCEFDGSGCSAPLLSLPYPANARVEWAAAGADSCTETTSVADFATGGLTSGFDDSISEPELDTVIFEVECVHAIGGSSRNQTSLTIVPPPAPTLNVWPRDVQRGQYTRLEWNLNGRIPDSPDANCRLTTGPEATVLVAGADLAATNNLWVQVSGRSQYTLKCDGNQPIIRWADVRELEMNS